MRSCPKCGHTFTEDGADIIQQIAAGMLSRAGGSRAFGETLYDDFTKVKPESMQRGTKGNAILRTIVEAQKAEDNRAFRSNLTLDQRHGLLIELVLKLLQSDEAFSSLWYKTVRNRHMEGIVSLPARLPAPEEVLDGEIVSST